MFFNKQTLQALQFLGQFNGILSDNFDGSHDARLFARRFPRHTERGLSRYGLKNPVIDALKEESDQRLSRGDEEDRTSKNAFVHVCV